MRLRSAAALFIALSAVGGPQSPDNSTRKTVRISGQVNDASGSPIQYEAVELAGGAGFQVKVPTNVDGKFTFDAVSPGKYQLRTLALGYMPLSLPVDASNGKDVDAGILTLRVAVCDQIEVPRSHKITLGFLHRTKRIRASGRVIDQTGSPIPRVVVEALRDCDGSQTLTNGDGVFTFPKLGPYSYQLRVRGPGFLPVLLKQFQADKGSKRIDLGTVVITK